MKTGNKKFRKKREVRRSKWAKSDQKLHVDLGTTAGKQRWIRELLGKVGMVLSVVLLVYLGVLIVQLFHSWEIEPKLILTDTPMAIVVSGNSSIPSSKIEEWVREHTKAKLSAINVFELKQFLESQGQIKSAEIEKHYPDTLNIDVSERLPVMILRTRKQNIPESTIWAIDREGVIFIPADLGRVLSLSLPFVQDAGIRETVDGVSQVHGVEQAYFILQLLEHEEYDLFKAINIVSFERYAEGEKELGAVIIFKSETYPQLVFGVDHFEDQVLKLKAVLSVSEKIELNRRSEIDLSLGEDALIR